MEVRPLLSRLKKRYTSVPRATGIWLEARDSGPAGTLVRSVDYRFLAVVFQGEEELKKLITQTVKPHVLVLEKNADPDGGLAEFINREHETVISADLLLVMESLGLGGLAAAGEWILRNGLDLKPKPPVEGAIPGALLALAGLFYLADEYEYREGSVTPLYFEGNRLFSFLRLVPYGEVTTFGEIAKTLGLQWNEQMVMKEISRLPGEAEMFGHRVVHRDGRLSELFPGGSALQRELLKWEMVPFAAGERVELKLALWTRQKYLPITNYLNRALRRSRFVELTFPEIEKILGFPLSRAARRLGSWWNDDRPHAWIWQKVGGRVVNVNMKAATVVFGSEQR